MDIRPKSKGKTHLSLSTSKYPHDVQLYIYPPTFDINLIEFHELAFDRLKVLRTIEEVTLRGRTKYTEDWRSTILSEIRKQGLKKFASLFSSGGSNVTTDESVRRADHVSHYVLRLAYCNSQKNQSWFIMRELELFRLRFGYLTQEGVHNFIKFNKLDYAAISTEEKLQVLNHLVQCSFNSSPADVELSEYFKVRFEDVPDLIRSRRVFLREGLAYVPASELVHLFTYMFRGILSRGLMTLARVLPLLEGDPRLGHLLGGLHEAYIGRDYSQNTDEQASILPQDIDQFAIESFPPCMQRMHSQLRSTHHLHHFGRLRYCLFLKGAGLSYENSYQFFKEEFTKGNPEKFEKDCGYTIKHSYGKVGSCRDYTPYSCIKLIMDSPNEGSCPFKYESRITLKTWLSSVANNSQYAQSILQFVDNEQYGQACSKYFEMIHGEESESLISHPNQFFEESRCLRTGKGKKQPEKLRLQKITQVPVKDKDDVEEAIQDNVEDIGLKMEDFDEWDGSVLCPQSIPSAEEDGLDEDGCQRPLKDPTVHISKRIIQISVKRDPDGSLGFTLCGGSHADDPTRSLFVSHIRRGGPVHREGSIRPGDRLLAVDGHSMEHASLTEAQSFLQHHDHCERWRGEDNLDSIQESHPCCSGECYTLLVVEYDVVEREGLAELRVPLLVELKLDYPDEELGLSLAMLPEDGVLPQQKRSAALIEAVRPASIAERCGALHSGDILLSIGKIHHRDVKKEGNFVTGPHARQSWVMHIQVLPLSQMGRPTSAGGSDCESDGSKQDLVSADSHVVNQSQCDASSGSSSSESLMWNSAGSQRWPPPPPPPLPPRRESSEHIPPQIMGCDSSLIHGAPCEEISNLEAFLQSTNFRDSNDSEKMDLWKRNSLSFTTFDLDCAHISDIQDGSQDQIDFSRLKQPIPWFGANNENLEARFSPLHGGEVDSGSNRLNANVSSTTCFPLKPYAGDRDAVIHVVQVARNGGPLGITLSGTEDPSEHITISGLVEGGPARCTAALQVGDRLLAVGGESLRGRPLSEAVALLRAASDPVLLHVSSNPSVDHSLMRNGINDAKTPSCNLETEDTFLSRFTNAIARIDTETDEAADIPPAITSHSPDAICSCPSTNFHQPTLKQCTNSKNLSSTVNVLHGPLLYELDPQSSLNHSSPSSVGSIRRVPSAQPMHSETLHITLFKDGIYEDFGFSVSDGLYERGVYVNRIRKGGPADVASLQPYDRIIQVNDTITYAFDCCLTVPLIASAGDKIDLTVVRCPTSEVKNLSY